MASMSIRRKRRAKRFRPIYHEMLVQKPRWRDAALVARKPDASGSTIVDAMNQIHAQSKPSPDVWYTSTRIGQLIKQMVSEVAA